MLHHFRRGFDVRLPGAPGQRIGRAPKVGRVGLLPADHRGLAGRVLVAEGDVVAQGTPLVADRHRAELVLTAPLAGQVTRVEMGARRQPALVELALEAGEALSFPTHDVRAAMLASGLWPALRRRPFGAVPAPDEVPDAIFVTAHETEPLAPDPAVVVTGREEDLTRGAAALEALTEGPVFICQGPGAPLAEARGRVRVERFRGAHPAGLAGTHVDRLMPLRPGRVVWTIGLQDVLELGHLLATGRREGLVVVSLAGPGSAEPRLVRVPQGALLEDVTAGELRPGSWRVVSGSPLSGVGAGYLRRGHRQVSVLAPALPRQSKGLPAATLPTRGVLGALGPEVPVVPLLRALSVGDDETASRLGAGALLEEDMGLLTYAAGGSPDYGALLRRVLDRLEAAA